MLAILERHHTGVGQRVEAALSYTSSTITGSHNVDYEGFNRIEIGGPGARGTDSFNRLYKCSDGWIFLSASSDSEILNFKSLPYFSESVEFGKASLLETIFETKSVSEWEIILCEAGIPAVRNNSASDLHQDSYNQERGMVESANYQEVSEKPLEFTGLIENQSSWGVTTWAGNPVSMSVSELVDVTPPAFGAHTHEVLKEAGLSDNEISELVSSGAIPSDLPISFD
jgi:crotonobetainyl-CoA:carnitine CoA-transferase CaiB-like acyl-CoA transferase